jgi:hypothetical protein
MPTYQLNFTLTPTQVRKIHSAYQNLTIAKQNPLPAGSPYNVAWVTFPPTSSDIVSWDETYLVYASRMQIEAGTQIILESVQAANSGQNWGWSGSLFTGPGPLSSQSYGVMNQAPDPDPWVFGLAQQAHVNGTLQTAPLNIVSAIDNERVLFTPIETVYAFLSPYDNNGTVITSTTDSVLMVQLTSISPSANLIFNDSANRFQLASASEAVLVGSNVGR